MHHSYVRTTVAIATLVLAVAGTSAYFLAFRPVSFPEEPTPVTVRLKWVHQAQFAGIYAAQELGYYAQRGLEVTIEPGGIGVQAIPAVLAGDVDFGVAGADDLLAAVSEDAPIRAVAAIYQKSPVVYFARSDSGITTPADFVGRRVGVKRNTGTYYTYIGMLQAVGIDRADITEIDVGPDLAPFYQNEVDVWPGFRINESEEVKRAGYDITLIRPEDYGIDLYADVLVVSTDLIERDPETVRSFVRATIDGWEYAIAHVDEAADLTMEYAEGTTREHQVSMLEQSVPLVKPSEAVGIGQMRYAEWRRVLDFLLENGLVPEGTDLARAYTTEFLEW